MFRKAMFVFALALSLFGSVMVADPGDPENNPIPDCRTCPWNK